MKFKSLEDFSHLDKLLIDELKESINRIELNINEKGRYLADWFWNYSSNMREESGEFAKFGTRVRRVKGAFVAEWYTNTLFTDSSSGDQRMFSNYIKKGEGDRYLKSAFRRALPWEKEMIYKIEDGYACLRKRSRALTKVKLALAQLEKTLEEELSHDFDKTLDID